MYNCDISFLMCVFLVKFYLFFRSYAKELFCAILKKCMLLCVPLVVKGGIGDGQGGVIWW